MLSNNDLPLAREVFDRFSIGEEPVTDTMGTASNGAGQEAGELIVNNP